MLVDKIEIARIGTPEGHTAKYWKDKSYSSVERFLSGAKIQHISADNVNLNGEALRWKFRFSRFINESYPLEYIYLHSNYNDVVYDSISTLPLVGGQNIIDEWIDSDAAIEKAELLGGSTFRNDYPDYVINAGLYQALVPDSYPIWEIISKSQSDPTKKLSLIIDARDLNTWNDPDDNYPKEFSLSQNYPNPFNPTTKIKYSIPTSPQPSPYKGEGARVRLKVYDILGNEVATLVNEEQPAGEYEVELDGSKFSSGIYFYQLKVGNFIETKKLLLLK
ncbi:MAG: T9SS C-terminal target domain-containing protein [Ignavibacteriales bacterium]|nr:MAG: T9SS C-terminal target domain-containing protein [Ignavibacteriales bacterium]